MIDAKALLEGTTPGPWLRVDGPDYAEIVTMGIAAPIALVGKAANADMIAAAPILAALVIELEAEVARLREALRAFNNGMPAMTTKDTAKENASLKEKIRVLLNYEGHHVWCGHAADDSKACVCGLIPAMANARAALEAKP